MRELNLSDLNQISGGDSALTVNTIVVEANNAALAGALGTLLLSDLTPDVLSALLIAAQIQSIELGNYTIIVNNPTPSPSTTSTATTTGS